MNAYDWYRLEIPIVDVRSPSEYRHAHIPGAISLPLFSDEERAEIGTLYKQVGRDAAVLRGLEITGPKMASIVRTAKEIAGGKALRLYCWRGGMRSGSVSWLLQQAGIETHVLKGGYKAYRNWILSDLDQVRNYVVLAGPTGSGKTETLHALHALGEQIIDLEALAGHRGSSYGALGLPQPPSSEQFENNLFSVFHKLDPGRRIWLEDESKTIGKCYLPLGFWNHLRLSPIIQLGPPFESRKERLCAEYGSYPKEQLYEATARLEKRIGNEAVRNALQALEEDRLGDLLDIVLKYYDKTYYYGLFMRQDQIILKTNPDSISPERCAQQIISLLPDPKHALPRSRA